jgi:regulatory protein
MKITSLQLKNNRVQVFVDEKYAFSCTQNFVVKRMLYSDKEVSVEELAELMVEAQRSIVEYKLAEYATRGLYSRRELSQKVDKYSQKRFGFVFEEDDMNAALKRLEDARLYDENMVVKALINAYTSRKKSRNYILSKLLSKGFGKKLVESFLEESNPQDFTENLKTILERKLPSIEKKAKDKFELKQKLIQFASGKGFQYKDIKTVLDELLP